MIDSEKIEELVKKEISQEANKIRQGGKQKSFKCPLKHSNFYYCFDLNIVFNSLTEEQKEELKTNVRTFIIKLSEKIEDEFLILQGSKQGEKLYQLPINDTREKLKLRYENKPKIKYLNEVGPQTGKFYVHYLFSLSKRGLDCQILNKNIKDFADAFFKTSINLFSTLHRDAKGDLNIYATNQKVI